MVQGRDRRVELGYQLALECRKLVGVYPLKNKNSKYNPPPTSMTSKYEEGATTEKKEGDVPSGESSQQQIAVASSA